MEQSLGGDHRTNGPGASLFLRRQGSLPGICTLAVVFALLLIPWSLPAAQAQDGGFGIAQPDDTRLQFVSSWGGAVEAVTVIDTTAYAAIGRRFVVLDVSDEQNPVEIGSLDMGARVLDLDVGDGFAVVVTEGTLPKPLSVVDLTDPTAPRKTWSFEYFPEWQIDMVRLHNNVAYLADHNNRPMYVLDLSNPANPSFLGDYWFVPGNIRDYVILEDLLYVLDESSSGADAVRAFDLSVDLLNPPLLDSEFIGGGALQGTSLAVEGAYAVVILEDFVHTDADILKVVDVSDPGSLITLGSTDEIRWGTDVALANGVAHVSDYARLTFGDWDLVHGLAMFDVAANPFAPPLIGEFKTHGATRGVEVFGGTAYTFDDGEGLVLVDVILPSDPVRLGTYYSPAFPRMAERVGSLLYVADAWNGITILNVANPARSQVVGVYQNPHWGLADHWGIDVEDELAYFAAGWAGVQVVNVSDPSSPFLEGEFETWPAGVHAAALEYDDGIAHVGTRTAAGGGWLVNFHVSDPQAIMELGDVELGGQPLTIRTTPEGIAHIARESHAVVDTSDPSAPFLIDQGLPTAVDADLVGNLLFLADRRSNDLGGLYIKDASDWENGLSFFPARHGSAVAVLGERAYFTGDDPSIGHRPGLFLLDVSAPESPALLSRVYLPRGVFQPTDIVAFGRFALVTTDVGIQVFSIGGARLPVHTRGP